MFLMFAAGLIWYALKGKREQQLSEDLVRADRLIKELTEDALRSEKKKTLALEEKEEAQGLATEREKKLTEVEGELRRSLQREEQIEKEMMQLRGLLGFPEIPKKEGSRKIDL